MRPALLLLCRPPARGDDGEEEVTYAAVVEFIHTATLIHDDIIDHADAAPRPAHGQPPLGQQPHRAARRLALHHRHADGALARQPGGDRAPLRRDPADDRGRAARARSGWARPTSRVDEYFEIIDRKTAHLFAAACSMPGLIARRGAPEASAGARALRPRARHLLPARRRPARLHRPRERARQAGALRPEGGQAHPAAHPAPAARRRRRARRRIESVLEDRAFVARRAGARSSSWCAREGTLEEVDASWPSATPPRRERALARSSRTATPATRSSSRQTSSSTGDRSGGGGSRPPKTAVPVAARRRPGRRGRRDRFRAGREHVGARTRRRQPRHRDVAEAARHRVLDQVPAGGSAASLRSAGEQAALRAARSRRRAATEPGRRASRRREGELQVAGPDLRRSRTRPAARGSARRRSRRRQRRPARRSRQQPEATARHRLAARRATSAKAARGMRPAVRPTAERARPEHHRRARRGSSAPPARSPASRRGRSSSRRRSAPATAAIVGELAASSRRRRSRSAARATIAVAARRAARARRRTRRPRARASSRPEPTRLPLISQARTLRRRARAARRGAPRRARASRTA